MLLWVRSGLQIRCLTCSHLENVEVTGRGRKNKEEYGWEAEVLMVVEFELVVLWMWLTGKQAGLDFS